MARQIALALIVLAITISMVMADVAPSASPKSSPSSSSPKSSPKPSPSTPAPSTSYFAASPSEEEETISSPPAQSSEPIELFASAPVDDEFAPLASPVADETISGVSTLRVSAVAATVVVAAIFAF